MQLYIENLPLPFSSLPDIQSFVTSLSPRIAYMFDGCLVYLDSYPVAMIIVSHVRLSSSFIHYMSFKLWK